MENYAILELPNNAPIEDVKKAYKRLALKCHPDKNPTPEAAEKFKRISEAYQAIIDPPPQPQHQVVNPHDFFQQMFSQFHQGFHININQGFNINPAQHTISIQNGKKIDVIIQNQNGQTIKQTIVTDLQTNAVTIETQII
jgi:DnaJ-class molecular chaperone